jgi:hypothetical protein
MSRSNSSLPFNGGSELAMPQCWHSKRVSQNRRLAMRGAEVLVVCFLIGGCAITTERTSLGYGDYVALSCDQLGQEAVRLMREAAGPQ